MERPPAKLTAKQTAKAFKPNLPEMSGKVQIQKSDWEKMSDSVRRIRSLLRPRPKMGRNWYMKPTAALRHEDLLLVLFGWEFEGSMRYALNFRKVEDDDIQLAAEIVRPMRLDTLKVERIKADANAGDPTADDFQEALICGLIDAFDILEHFSICNVEAPTPIKNLISGAMALLEKEDISEASTASRVQVRVANRL